MILVKKSEALNAIAVVVRLYSFYSPPIEWDHVLSHGLVAFLAAPVSVAEDKIKPLTFTLVVIQEASKPQLLHLVCNNSLDLLLVRNLNRQI